MEAFPVIQLCLYLVFCVVFHLCEYFINKRNHPESTDFGSLLLSIPFAFAFLFGATEYVSEVLIYKNLKTDRKNPLVWIGLVLVIIGQTIRVTALLTAKQAFTHNIEYKRESNHKLVTDGIYRYVRHPGYLGMLIFSVGTQIFLTNPISTVVFIAVLWKYFSDRIQDEETALVAMFGDDYVKYRGRTPTWIPGIE